MTVVSVATEDELSEAVALRLLSEHRALSVGQRLRRDGSGYLRSRMASWCQFAQWQPLLLITDLDLSVCPEELLAQWFGPRARPIRLLFRVAVREIEAWLLSDHEAMQSFIGNPQLRLPDFPENVSDPKMMLISLAKKAPRRIREAIVPAPGSIASKGLGYNRILINEFLPKWSPIAAAQRSPSLARARTRIAELTAAGF